MSSNPFIRLLEAPVETLTATAYVLVLLAFLVLTWYALGRNILTLQADYRDGWYVLPPFVYVVRIAGALVIIAIDLLLIATIIYTLA